MKKLIISLLAAILLTGCSNFSIEEFEQLFKKSGETKEEAKDTAEDDLAMQNSPHLKFKNVPIDGTLDKFVERMERNGFKKARGNSEGKATLVGDFAGFKDCKVYVETLQNQDLVSRITVCFPDQKQWEYLYGDYTTLKEMLTTKYGKPTSCVEKFQSSYLCITLL